MYGSANRVYDEVLERKVYIRPGMDCYTEFSEGVGRQKHFVLATVNPAAMRLDEWAEEFSLSVSQLIEQLRSADWKKDRDGEEDQFDEDDPYAELAEEVACANV